MENGTSSGDRLGEGNGDANALDLNETHIVPGAGDVGITTAGTRLECTRFLEHPHLHPHLHLHTHPHPAQPNHVKLLDNFAAFGSTSTIFNIVTLCI